MGELGYTYDDVIDASIRCCWQIEDILPDDVEISFDRPHLPDALADIESIEFLSRDEKLALNHLRGLSYMNLFAFVEEYIIAMTVNHAQAEMFGDHSAVRALLRFGEEELKHQELFKRYCRVFQRDLGRECRLLGAAGDVANIILDNSPLAVMLATLHLEIMTQKHYTNAVKDDTDLDPLVVSILKHHWLEESQHTRIDMLELERMARFGTAESAAEAVDQYLGILTAFDGLLARQVEMDTENLADVGVSLTGEQRAELQRRQHASYRKDFLVMGMSNRRFLETVDALSPGAEAKIEAAAAELS